MMKSALVILSIWMLSQSSLNSMSGTVVAVQSGDSFSLNVDGELFRIRLADVDCPEVKQSMYRQAMQFTRDLILGKLIRVNYEMIDRFGTVVAYVVLPDGRILNEVLLKEGWAWHYRVRVDHKIELEQLEYEAWSARLGIWVDPEPVPPWVYRREGRLPTPPSSPSGVDYDQILNYGLVGNVKTKVFSWPACSGYQGRVSKWKSRKIFSNKLQAESLGYKADKSCRSNRR